MGKLIIISGDSGTGKTTILKGFISLNCGNILLLSELKTLSEEIINNYQFIGVDEIYLKEDIEFLIWLSYTVDIIFTTQRNEVSLKSLISRGFVLIES